MKYGPIKNNGLYHWLSCCRNNIRDIVTATKFMGNTNISIFKEALQYDSIDIVYELCYIIVILRRFLKVYISFRIINNAVS